MSFKFYIGYHFFLVGLWTNNSIRNLVRGSVINLTPVQFNDLMFNTSGAMLGIATEVLAGHIAAAKKDFPRAIGHLREAARLEDELVYGEPPEWTVPVRQELGAVLLKAGRAAEAEQAFREDLKRFPENGWSLYGLAQALRAQNRASEADAVMDRFQKTWATADVRLAGPGP